MSYFLTTAARSEVHPDAANTAALIAACVGFVLELTSAATTRALSSLVAPLDRLVEHVILDHRRKLL